MGIGAILAAVGPSIIRGIGSLFGGDTKKVTDKVADVVDAVKGKSPSEQAQAIQEHIASMSPAELQAFEQAKSKIVEAHANIITAQINAQRDEQVEVQKTAQAEQAQNDLYVKRTRPSIARKSFYLGGAYALITGVVFPLINQFFNKHLPNVDWTVFGWLISPVGAYMGMRTIDKVKGKTDGLGSAVKAVAGSLIGSSTS